MMKLTRDNIIFTSELDAARGSERGDVLTKGRLIMAAEKITNENQVNKLPEHAIEDAILQMMNNEIYGEIYHRLATSIAHLRYELSNLSMTHRHAGELLQQIQSLCNELDPNQRSRNPMFKL